MPRDGIPPIYSPEFESVAEADTWLSDRDPVVFLQLGEEPRAYPIRILIWHEIVDDVIAGVPVAVSYCPLCNTAVAFDRRLEGRTYTFGVSGLLYQSDLLLYDRESESLWSQIAASAIAGQATGKRLRVLRSALVTWGKWKARHPKTSVLSMETGHRRDYDRYPYGDYSSSEALMFAAPLDPRYHPKMPTLGIRLVGGAARAYPAAEIEHAGGQVQESFEGHSITVSYEREMQVFDVEAPIELEVIEGYWFAWAAFHPTSTVFVADTHHEEASTEEKGTP